MIRAATTTPNRLRPPPRGATTVRRIGDTLAGPGRAADPVTALAADIAEIAGTSGSVGEADLVSRGWAMAEIIEYLPGAMRRARGDVGGA